MAHERLFEDMAACVGVAWVLGVLAQWIRQPVILAYLAGGFLLGPQGFGWVHSEESIQTIAELGLIFLLFMIGLEIDLKKIASTGRTIMVTAAAQILGGCLIGLAVFRGLGFPLGGTQWDALYLAVGAALSSTVIIVKVLYDKRELDTLPGRITLGVLVLQDLFAILFLAVQPNLGNLEASVIWLSLARVTVLVAAALLLSRYVLPPLFRSVARLPELVLVGALAWCFGVGEIASKLELSREMGALVAGVALSTFPYVLDVAAKVTSLRDFFVTLFFVGLGMKVPLPTGSMLAWAGGFALFTILSRVATTFTPLYAMKQGLRTSLLPALNLCQISEFSLVVIGIGLQQKHLAPETVGFVGWAFVFLAVASTIGMMHSEGVLNRLIPVLKRLGLRDLDGNGATDGEAVGSGHAGRILILGFFRTASSLLEEIRRRKPELLANIAVVDFNPQAYFRLQTTGVRVVYGDISQRATLIHAGIEQAAVILCTIPDSLLKGCTNLKLVRQVRELNAHARIIATAEQLNEVAGLYAAGASYVNVTRLGEGERLCDVVAAADTGDVEALRAQVDASLKDRQEILP